MSSTEGLDRMLKSHFQTMARGHAEMAAGQEQALELTTSYAKSQIERLNDLAGETGDTIAELKESVVSLTILLFDCSNSYQLQLFPLMLSLSERQNALDLVCYLCSQTEITLTSITEI
jgi:hypothetical protein